MILYINGDSHAAAAEAVNPHAFAEDDGRYFYMGRAPHPDNLAVSWGNTLSGLLKSILKCDAESASSNTRILRTTKKWLLDNESSWYRTFVIIQWSTWEREEWLINDKFYQVNASGVDEVPESHQTRYKEYIASINWQEKINEWHEEIWNFHQWLNDRQIKHLFFNGNNNFSKLPQRDWGVNYIGPYQSDMTFHSLLQQAGFETVSPGSWHYGKDAHRWWARYLIKYMMDNKML